jgi:hydrogenase 3 maturation protease
MLESSWQGQLRQSLAGQKRANAAPRVAVVGVGHELRGDDAAGVALARRLRESSVPGSCLVIEAGSVPENFVGPLRHFQPHLVILVDAAQMGAEPGTLRWLPTSMASVLLSSTHGLPLNLLASYLEAELGCDVNILGIQPEAMPVALDLTPAVRQAVDTAAAEMATILFMS